MLQQSMHFMAIEGKPWDLEEITKRRSFINSRGGPKNVWLNTQIMLVLKAEEVICRCFCYISAIDLLWKYF